MHRIVETHQHGRIMRAPRWCERHVGKSHGRPLGILVEKQVIYSTQLNYNSGGHGVLVEVGVLGVSM